jgi:ABC-type dipeptide/oligopeptide/nickel transport system permease component
MIVFAITRLTGDPAALILGSEATDEQLTDYREAHGLNDPLPIQYGRFLVSAVRGEFGESLRYHQPALGLVLERLPATALLAAAALFLSVALALPLGVTAAVHRNGGWEHLSMLAALLGQSIPAFWLGLMLILIFPIGLGWFYTSGYGTPGHLVLPAVTLGLFHTARLTRLVRAGMLDVLGQDYIRTARAKGLSERVVLRRHAIRTMLLPIITVLGLEAATLLGGAVATETIFAWPGMGRLAVQAIAWRDFTLVQAVVFVAALTYVGLNLLVDLAYGWLDPRVRYA